MIKQTMNREKQYNQKYLRRIKIKSLIQNMSIEVKIKIK
jgi:hypothetical protein